MLSTRVKQKTNVSADGAVILMLILIAWAFTCIHIFSKIEKSNVGLWHKTRSNQDVPTGK